VIVKVGSEAKEEEESRNHVRRRKEVPDCFILDLGRKKTIKKPLCFYLFVFEFLTNLWALTFGERRDNIIKSVVLGWFFMPMWRPCFCRHYRTLLPRQSNPSLAASRICPA
jgi:hypothetical protein